jgi:hypothetical protein
VEGEEVSAARGKEAAAVVPPAPESSGARPIADVIVGELHGAGQVRRGGRRNLGKRTGGGGGGGDSGDSGGGSGGSGGGRVVVVGGSGGGGGVGGGVRLSRLKSSADLVCIGHAREGGSHAPCAHGPLLFDRGFVRTQRRTHR